MANDMRLIVCTFEATDRASDVSSLIQRLDSQLDTIRLGNIAIVQRTSDGQISFRETRDMRNELSEIAGIVAGGVAWLAYAIVGSFGPQASEIFGLTAENAVAQRLRDHGFTDEALYELGERLRAGQSALITLVRPAEESTIVAELESLGGTIVSLDVAPELAAELLTDPRA